MLKRNNILSDKGDLMFLPSTYMAGTNPWPCHDVIIH